MTRTLLTAAALLAATACAPEATPDGAPAPQAPDRADSGAADAPEDDNAHLDIQSQLTEMECGTMYVAPQVQGTESSLFAAEEPLTCGDLQALVDAELALERAQVRAAAEANKGDFAQACTTSADAWTALHDERFDRLGGEGACLLHATAAGATVERVEALEVASAGCDRATDYGIVNLVLETHEPLFVLDTVLDVRARVRAEQGALDVARSPSISTEPHLPAYATPQHTLLPEPCALEL